MSNLSLSIDQNAITPYMWPKYVDEALQYDVTDRSALEIPLRPDNLGPVSNVTAFKELIFDID